MSEDQITEAEVIETVEAIEERLMAQLQTFFVEKGFTRDNAACAQVAAINIGISGMVAYDCSLDAIVESCRYVAEQLIRKKKEKQNDD